ncbi:MAG: hypothetical protein ACI4JS_06170 [Oscillospiraceae bacterium]
MKSIDILDAIGSVDSEYVIRAKAKNTSCKKLWIAIGSLAACMALVVTLPFALIAFRGASSPAPENTDMLDVGIGSGEVLIYYVDGDKLGSTTRHLDLEPKGIFNAWREMNSIGDEVEFVKCFIEDNGVTTESEINGVGVVTHQIGDYFVFNLTISQKIENYYDTTDRELLLDSLEQTMTGYLGLEFDEFNLILV